MTELREKIARAMQRANRPLPDPLNREQREEQDDVSLQGYLTMADAALAAIEAAGWQCVPKKATVEMQRLGAAKMWDQTKAGLVGYPQALEVFDAMLKAAPKP